jgi:integrase
MKRPKYPRYCHPMTDVRGKLRLRFRRKGYPTHYPKAPFGTKDFEREYALWLSQEPMIIGAGRVKHGTFDDGISRYYADNAFLDLAPATQKVFRGVLERFRSSFGSYAMTRFDAARIAQLMNGMRDKPHAAARLRKLLAQLFKIARRDKLVPAYFDPIRDTAAPKPKSNTGYHRWTEEELSAFEAAHALGTKPRLAFALLLYSAQRSGDVRLLTPDTIARGRIPLDQSKTGNAVDVPIVAPLRDALDAGPIGVLTILESNRREPFTEKGFYNLIKKACRSAGIPHCSPHGLRKSAARRCREGGCTDEEGMAITGHKTIREYRRYAGETGNAARADTAMGKVMANIEKTLATAPQKTTESCGDD